MTNYKMQLNEYGTIVAITKITSDIYYTLTANDNNTIKKEFNDNEITRIITLKSYDEYFIALQWYKSTKR